MFIQERVGPDHPSYDHEAEEFTQVIVWEEEGDVKRKIAHFVGYTAKLDAATFVSWKNSENMNFKEPDPPYYIIFEE